MVPITGILTKMDPSKKDLYTAKRPSGVNTEDPAISCAWENLRSDSTDCNWILLFLNTPSVVAVRGTGDGGVPEFISNLNDDEILFGAIRLVIEGQVKFFHVFFVGQNVGAMKKGKASLYEAGVFQALEGAHGKLSFSGGLESCTLDAFADQLNKITRNKFGTF